MGSIPSRIATQLVEGVAKYSDLLDQPSRTSLRAKLLHWLDELVLEQGGAVTARRVTEGELATKPAIRGAIVMHLDLVFRSSVSSREVAFTARHGVVMVAFHEDLPQLPVAVVLCMPAEAPTRVRASLFDPTPPALDRAPYVVPYAVAASPPGLGAGRLLLLSAIAECAALPAPPRVVTFSPLTGLRARVIRLVDDDAAWRAASEHHPGVDCALARGQLLQVLECDRLPASIAAPADAWLVREARCFAESIDYAVGNFHRRMGAELVDLCPGADPDDSDALWWRAHFDYGVARALS